jgi:hypothetical protein
MTLCSNNIFVGAEDVSLRIFCTTLRVDILFCGSTSMQNKRFSLQNRPCFRFIANLLGDASFGMSGVLPLHPQSLGRRLWCNALQGHEKQSLGDLGA